MEVGEHSSQGAQSLLEVVDDQCEHGAEQYLKKKVCQITCVRKKWS